LEAFTGLTGASGITITWLRRPPNWRTRHGKIETNVKDALDYIRAATQELHGAISDAAAKRGGATKADLVALAKKAKAVTESVEGSISTQRDAAKASCGWRDPPRSDAEARRREFEELRPVLPQFQYVSGANIRVKLLTLLWLALNQSDA